jgi:hypothetical protein
MRLYEPRILCVCIIWYASYRVCIPVFVYVKSPSDDQMPQAHFVVGFYTKYICTSICSMRMYICVSYTQKYSQEVLGLDVSVHDALTMQVCNTAQHVSRHAGNISARQKRKTMLYL